MNVIDLFCGAGGMSTGLRRAGFNVVAAVDVWDKAVESYRANHEGVNAVCADISTLDPAGLADSADIVVGGPPCQGFSMAGRRDASDPRNSLFIHFVRFIDHFSPKAFIMENVMGILTAKNEACEPVIDIIMSCLSRNYNCVISRLYASDFGVPQNRRRVIIIGVRKDLGIIPTEPAPVTAGPARPAVGAVLAPREDAEASLFLSDKALAGIARKKKESKARGAGFGAQFLRVDEPSFTIPARYWKDGYDALVRYSDTDVRRLSVLELKRIQTFPDDYVLCGNKREQITQIGNAVACTFAYHIGMHVARLFSK